MCSLPDRGAQITFRQGKGRHDWSRRSRRAGLRHLSQHPALDRVGVAQSGISPSRQRSVAASRQRPHR